MRLSWWAAALAAVWLGSGLPAQADTPPAPCPYQPEMTFTAWNSTLGQQFGSGAREYIFAEGSICPDTDQKFQQFLDANPPKAPNTIVVLNSGGGDVGAGLAMGRIIRLAKMWTQVGSRFPLMIGGNQNIPPAAVPFLSRASSPPFPGYCYSSCTFTFMGGVNRWIDYDSNYGVHRFEFDDSVPNPVDQAQIDSATLVAYIEEMGISPNYMVEMVKQGGDNVTNLSMKVLQQLNIVTPRWATSWQIAPLSDNTGFFLDGATTDPWGAHDIAVTCAPASTAPPAPSSAQTATPPPPVVLMKFSLDPGPRAKAQDVVGAVQSYVLALGSEWATLPAALITQPASVAGDRLSATISFNQSQLTSIESAAYLGFTFMFDPNAKLPLRLLQFEADLDSDKLKQFAATCH
jgi:hypothetical protein